MRTDVLQAAALCSYGNAFLSNLEEKAPELMSQNGTFKQVYELAFVRRNQTGHASEKETTGTWLQQLRAEGVDRLRLYVDRCSHDPKTQGTDPWGILADGDRGCELWRPSWKLRSFSREDATPYRVVYTAERFNLWSLTPQFTIEEAHAKMTKALTMARQFAYSQHMTQLLSPFDRCISLHGEGNIDMLAFGDICPEGFAIRARALMASVLRMQLVLGSHLWAIADKDAAIQAEFSVNTLRLWHAGMICLSSASANGQGAAAQPKPLESPLSEAS